MNEFSLESYQELILNLRNAGYTFLNFEGVDTHSASAHYVILRHDVDFSLRGAIKIAEVETRIGVNSTFFVHLRSPFYNALSKHGSTTIQSIHQLGHDIALHLDLSLYPDDYLEGLRKEMSLLTHYFPFANTTVISFHRPRNIKYLQSKALDSISHTYEPRFFNEIAYISDSDGVWKYGHPITSKAFVSREPIQLLTHPLWWTEDGDTPLEKLACFLANNRVETLGFLKNNLKISIDL